MDSEGEEDDAVKPLSERLITELTTYRTLALRDALANDPGVAFAAMLHAICLGAFYMMSSGTCLEISAKSASFNTQAPGLADSPSAKAIEVRHQQWAKQLPQNAGELWDVLTAFDRDSQTALFAHCASLSVNVVTRAVEPQSATACPRRCQSALEWDPLSAFKRDPFERRVLTVALAPSELVGVAETARVRAV